MTEPKGRTNDDDLLETIRDDAESSTLRPMAEYLSLFPGREAEVAREYLRMSDDSRREGRRPNRDVVASGRIGPYRLLEELGRGSQGMVWLAEDERLGRRVAVKIFTGLGPGAEAQLARFKREAMVASKLEHPGICGVHDAGIEDGVPFIAMRYVEGESLAQRLARAKAPLADPEGFVDSKSRSDENGSASSSIDRADVLRTVALFEKAAIALHAAHEAGIIHRDLKPANIMITRSDEPVILDFGLARDDSDETGPSLTQTGDVFGTPAYMPPEQVSGRGATVDRRSDIWSLGVALHECLTLRRPFDEPTRDALYQAILTKEPERARRLNRQIPSDLEVVLQCTLEKERDRRYQTAADLAEDLRRVRLGEPVLARKISTLGRAWRWSKRRPAAASLLLALALGIPMITGLGVWYWNHRDDVVAQARTRLEERIEGLLESGLYELHHGSNEQAVAALSEALELDAASAEAAVGLTQAHLKRSAPEVALAVLIRAERDVAEPGVLARTKADVLRALHREDEAKAVEAAAPPIHGTLMWFLEGLRALNEGHLHSDPRPIAQVSHKRAVEMFTLALQSSPRVRRVLHFQLAHATGHVAGADGRIVAKAIESLWPHSAAAWRWAAFACHGKPDEAILAYRESLRIDPDDVEVEKLLSWALTQAGRFDEAAESAKRAVAMAPHNADAYLKLGNALRFAGKYEESIPALREAIRIQPQKTDLHFALGSVMEHVGRLDEAEAAYREAIRIAPENGEYFVNLSSLLDRAGRKEESLSTAKEAVRLAPDLSEAHVALGNVLASIGQFDAAASSYQAAIRQDEKSVDGYTGLGLVYSKLGRIEESIEFSRKALALAPESAAAYLNLGLSLANANDRRGAITALETALEKDPQFVPAYLNLGGVLVAEDRIDEGLAAFDEALRLSPDSALAYVNIGIARYKQDRLGEAFRNERKGHELGLRMGKAWAHPSAMWLEATAIDWTRRLYTYGLSERATAILANLVATYPDMKDAAALLDEQRGIERSQERIFDSLEAALDLNADNVDALCGMARLLADPESDADIRDPSEALFHAKKAVELTKGEDPFALHILALALTSSGDARGAVDAERKALDMIKDGEADGLSRATMEAALEHYLAMAGSNENR